MERLNRRERGDRRDSVEQKISRETTRKSTYEDIGGETRQVEF